MMAGLTDAEQRALALTGELVTLVCREVIGHGRTRDQDINEFCDAVHRIQHMLMAQAAGRAHPELYRLLGDTVG